MARAKTATAEQTGPAGPSDIDVSDIDANNPESADLSKAIEKANSLIEKKKEVLAELQSVRQYCDLSVAAGNGSPEQVAWIRFYLPRKKRKENGTTNGAEAAE